jgi:4-hydroxy-tetrahydrodipicolinate synthase
VSAAGVSGVCLSGATGEYASASEAERLAVVRLARTVLPADFLVLAGLGAADFDSALALARPLSAEGVDGFLVPPPYFFPYPEADVEEFYRALVPRLDRPVLLYNLPSFTSVIPQQTAIRLIETLPGVIGVKDSSGRTGLLEELTARRPAGTRRVIGNDAAFRTVLTGRLCDASISGVAGVLPELTVGILSAAGEPERLETHLQLLEQLLPRLDAFPVPWGLKLMAEARGWYASTFAMPLSADRRRQAAEFAAWFQPWWEGARRALAAGAQ